MFHLITEIFPPAVGGSGKWFYEVFRRMAPDQYRVITKDCLASGSEIDKNCHGNIKRIPFALAETGGFSLKGMATYRKITQDVLGQLPDRKKGSSEVIVAGRMVPEGWIAAGVARRRGARFVCFAHGEEINKDHHSSVGVMSSRQHRWMGAYVARCVDHWIANSRNTSEILRQQWNIPANKITVIHPGVDTDFFHPADRDEAFRARMGWQGRFVLLTVGRLQKRKGHDHLILALPELLKRHRELVYVIIGDGKERETLQNLVNRLSLQGSVMFLEQADDDLVRQCYQQADLFVLPNRSIGTDIEGFGMVLVEAGACGIPVCAGKSGGTSETMIDGKTGFLLDCSSPETLERELSKVLIRPDLRSIGSVAADYCRTTFGWPRLVETLHRVLDANQLDRDARRAIETQPDGTDS